ncbi:hypothetical protein [Phyllobacterium chamaecytisi]|uniref:hypothetical protein n=1 Tax=Phyllobacterium chamaecytisi TaxID=2876082 RepID=UPI001CCD2ED5|nr:hypothetical protein [Phyllobacterium sp. KW56]MBZ9600499.1 hypothetical protein [Phyllobacterium sp. KW56]
MAREAFMARLPKWDSDIDQVKAWPTATRYIRAGDETRAESLAKYAAANDNSVAPPIATNHNSPELLSEMGVERIYKIRPTVNEVTNAGKDGIQFDSKGRLTKWRSSDGKWRNPWEEYRKPKGVAMHKSKDEQLEELFDQRTKDATVLSNRHLVAVLAGIGTDFPTTLPASKYPSEGVERYSAASKVSRAIKYYTTKGGKPGADWTQAEYDAAKTAYTGGITKLNGPALPRTEYGGFQDNMPSFIGMRIAGNETFGGSTRSWDDAMIERIDFKNAKAKLSAKTVYYLDMATTDARASEIGQAMGYQGKTAERKGVEEINSAVDEFISMAA